MIDNEGDCYEEKLQNADVVEYVQKEPPCSFIKQHTSARKVNFMNVIVYLGFPLLWNVITLGFFVTKRRGWIRKTKNKSEFF